MINWIWLGLLVAAVLTGELTGSLSEVLEGGLKGAKTAVELAIELIGQNTLWLGFMGIIQESGLLGSLVRGLRPVMRRLFPDVPSEHPAMGAMILNIAANMLGLNNAATPFGLRAMAELNRLNPLPGVATNAMALFLTLNASGVVLLATTALGVRVAAGSTEPAAFLVPSLVSTVLSTVVAVLFCKALQRLPRFAARPISPADVPEAPAVAAPAQESDPSAAAALAATTRPPAHPAARVATIAAALAITAAFGLHLWRASATTPAVDLARDLSSRWLLPLVMVGIALLGAGRGARVYEAFVSAAKEGFQISVLIIPYLVAILVAIGMFRASGALQGIVTFVGPVTAALGFPAEALPLALMKPLSGGGSLGILADTLKAHGPDSYVGFLSSILAGSAETTFYVLAVYYGSVQVRAMRHTLAACLLGDGFGIVIAAVVARAFW